MRGQDNESDDRRVMFEDLSPEIRLLIGEHARFRSAVRVAFSSKEKEANLRDARLARGTTEVGYLAGTFGSGLLRAIGHVPALVPPAIFSASVIAGFLTRKRASEYIRLMHRFIALEIRSGNLLCPQATHDMKYPLKWEKDDGVSEEYISFHVTGRGDVILHRATPQELNKLRRQHGYDTALWRWRQHLVPLAGLLERNRSPNLHLVAGGNRMESKRVSGTTSTPKLLERLH